MSQKRHGKDVGSDEGNSPEEKRQKVPAMRSVVLEAFRRHTFQKFLSGLEPLLRKIVKEEVEVALRKHINNMKQNGGKQVHPSESKSLQLKFRNKLSLPVFTGGRIEGEEGSIIEVALVDALTGQVFISGAESSAKVEIVVLEGDFEGGEDDDWTLEEFKNNIVKEREGKRPLLTGDTFVSLTEGVGQVGELAFTDNSSWTRSRKFRLGARVVDDNSNGVRVREARTESFMVKDHRGELYKKHYPPSLFDEVWRLEKIGKDGAFHKRLSRENIKTVKDFLTLFFIDSSRLRNILGTGMSTKMWEVTMDHARTCTIDNRMYLYHPPNAQQGTGVVFNVVGQALGLLSEGEIVRIDGLSETEKDDAYKLVKLAYENWGEVIFIGSSNIMNSSSNLPSGSFPSSSTVPCTSYDDNVMSSEFSFTPPSAPSSDIFSSLLSLGGTRTLDNFSVQGLDSMDLKYDQPASVPGQFSNSLNCDMEALYRSFCDGEDQHIFNPDPSLQSQSFCSESEADLRTAVNGFLATSARSAAAPAAAAAVDKADTKWSMLCRVIRWRFSIKRIVASKKCGHAKRRHG